MNGPGKVSFFAALLLVLALAGSIWGRTEIERLRGTEATLEDVLYLPSGKAVKRLSLGYSSLLADIYWTRAVQYFGWGHRTRAMHYSLLYPLLDITTDLDPKLIPAYEFGSIFLSQKPPEGAGEPDKAVQLVEKGVRANPEYWRLYFTLGFINYLDRKDYKAAQIAFEKGSEVPGALPWMKVMAARMAERADDISTALYLWKTVYDTTFDVTVKETALKHLTSLRADAETMALEKLVAEYTVKNNQGPTSWSDLVRAGVLGGIPVDPNGDPYKLAPGGRVQVENPALYPYLGQGRQSAK